MVALAGVGTEVVGRDLRGYFCGHTWAASPLRGRRDGIRSGWARLPPDGHPTCPLSLKAGPEPPVASGE